MWSDIVGWSDGFEPLYRKLVPKLRKNARIAEVGVAYGRSIALLDSLVLETGRPMQIFAVDCFTEHMGGEQKDKREWFDWARAQGSSRDAFTAALAKHSPGTLDRITIMHYFSVDAATLFDDASLDLVCIDANHDYNFVLEDVRAWLPKVKPGGFLIGDDYSLNNFPGVCQAVQEALPHFEVHKFAWLYEVPR
jgi:cephalosporin hydroxylase